MKVALAGGSYTARSVIAGHQRTLNLYPELTDPNTGEANKSVYMPTPGHKLLGTVPTVQGTGIRGLHTASNGEVFVVHYRDLYQIKWDAPTKAMSFTHLGKLEYTWSKPVKMSDNGIDLIMCDGGSYGYTVNLKDKSFAKIEVTNSGWLGSGYIDYADTFFIAHEPGFYVWYISESLSTEFDPLQFASKVSYPDKLQAAIVARREVWLIGEYSTEIWVSTGGGGLGQTNTGVQTNTFPYQLTPGQFEDRGCVAPYSVARVSNSVFWLAQTRAGDIFVVRGSGFDVVRITNHAIENEFMKYSRVDDAIAFCYEQGGHVYYVLSFPKADKTWVYDDVSQMWHERCSIDLSGREHRVRGAHHCFGFGMNLVGDYYNGNIYQLDPNTFTDNGLPIKRLKGFPQLVDTEKNDRLMYKSFVCDMDVGEVNNYTSNALVSLSWSDDKGKSFKQPSTQSLGNPGENIRNINFNRLGVSRNRLFQINWGFDGFSALSGGYVDVDKLGT